MTYLLVSIFFILALGYAKGNNEQTDSNIDSQRSPRVDDSDMFMEPVEAETGATNPEEHETQEKSQNTFYPSYSQPLGHSRPFYYQQEGAYSQRSQPFQQVFETPVRFSGYKEEYPAASTSSSSSETLGLLGSGNFGVIRGGTYYNDNDGEQSSYSDFNSYFHNGHGRPSFYGGSGGPPNPKPQKHEQFANFKDFADINTPPDRQYSQYVVVYANKNGTKQQDENEAEPRKILQRPKNIIESLAMLDLEPSTTTDAVPGKKLSKSKRKLAKLLPEKKYKVKLLKKEVSSKDLGEPLLALS